MDERPKSNLDAAWHHQRRCGDPGPLIQLTLYAGALAAGLIAGALSNSAVIGASVAGIAAVGVAALLRGSA